MAIVLLVTVKRTLVIDPPTADEGYVGLTKVLDPAKTEYPAPFRDIVQLEAITSTFVSVDDVV
ncbi:MAG: hypothetical protein Q7T89_08110 [Anaerolineales bacterium]|nr:hypothetical protein [Anaerolineales bacterium]